MQKIKNWKKGVIRMLNEEICKLREKLNYSILNEQDYNITYQISVELDELIAQYYNSQMKLVAKNKAKQVKNQKKKELVASN